MQLRTQKLPCTVPQIDSFLTDVIGYDRLKLYLKIYTLKMKSCYRPYAMMLTEQTSTVLVDRGPW